METIGGFRFRRFLRHLLEGARDELLIVGGAVGWPTLGLDRLIERRGRLFGCAN
ncbi:hypothetical protein [Variovorax sp.]|uniref:hypothetical protein n=1 Tax=unclassified Variovorax TaxID=663243 RepID=UPI0025E6D0E7|nr:hypothetical protein [Variovorax sp.]